MTALSTFLTTWPRTLIWLSTISRGYSVVSSLSHSMILRWNVVCSKRRKHLFYLASASCMTLLNLSSAASRALLSIATRSSPDCKKKKKRVNKHSIGQGIIIYNDKLRFPWCSTCLCCLFLAKNVHARVVLSMYPTLSPVKYTCISCSFFSPLFQIH